MQRTIETRSGRILVVPGDDENAQINATAQADADNQPLTAEQLAQFKPRNKGGRPAGSNKEQVSIRLDTDVLEAFRATGSGWQTKINDVLKEWTRHH